ncbi:hypothetical protein BJ912DRAFT_935761 [Pholiota molesta]|nr:hypothetical protein BJ912DRAFT_935761 [Pholiota molesta]
MTNMGLGVLVESYQGTAALSGSESVTAPLEVISSRTHGFAFPPFPPYPFVHTGDTYARTPEPTMSLLVGERLHRWRWSLKEGCENQQLLDAYDIPTGIYNNSAEYSIESDASSATYPLAIAAIIERCKVRQRGLEVIGYNKVVQTPTETTMQGPPIGQLKGLEEVDMTEMTDAFLTATVLATVAHGKTRIFGHRESAMSSGEEMCFEKTWWDDLQNKICSALHFARRRPGTIPRTRIPSEAEPEPYENFAHQHEDVRVRVVDGVQFGELAEFCDWSSITFCTVYPIASMHRPCGPHTSGHDLAHAAFLSKVTHRQKSREARKEGRHTHGLKDIPTLLDRKKRLQMALAAASAVEGSLDHLLESALETPAAAGPSNNQSQFMMDPWYLTAIWILTLKLEHRMHNHHIPKAWMLTYANSKWTSAAQLPEASRYQDNLPEPTSTLFLQLYACIGPQPEIGPLRRVMLIVRDRLITTANSFGIWRDYPRRPTRDLTHLSLLMTWPSIVLKFQPLFLLYLKHQNSSRPAYWPFVTLLFITSCNG